MTATRTPPWGYEVQWDVGPAPARSQFTRDVAEISRMRGLVPLLEKYRGEIPLAFLLGWIVVESDGRIDEITNLDERGFFQIHPAESHDRHFDHQRLSADPDYSVKAGIDNVRFYARLAQQRFPSIPAGSDLFWRVVKLQHAMGSGLAYRLLTAMSQAGLPLTWENIRQYEVTHGPALHPLLKVAPLGRFTHNVEEAMASGTAWAGRLGVATTTAGPGVITQPPGPAAPPPSARATTAAPPAPAAPATPPVNRWQRLFPTATRCRADFLIDGEQTYKAMLDAINGATGPGHYVYVLGWMLDADFQLVGTLPFTFYNALIGAAGRGVEIRVLIWDNFTPDYAKLHQDIIPRLNRLPNTRAYLDNATFFPPASQQVVAALGQQVRQLLMRYPELLVAGSAAGVGPRFLLDHLSFAIQHGVGAHHEKVVLVKGKDGLVAFCGGLDINRNRVTAEVGKHTYRFPHLHDAAVQVRGPAAFEVLQRFKRRWGNHPTARTIGLAGTSEQRPPEDPSVDTYVSAVGTYNSVDGRQTDRSLRDAYLKIVDNARNYIYIEDQYMVNLDVAARLNLKLKEQTFKSLTFVIQAASETTDILIPNRKRGEFMEAVLRGTSAQERAKVLLAVIDKAFWEQERYHPALHAKTLIADDEIAIIGSANLNQRSFTCDSETSLVVFNTASDTIGNFAARFRIADVTHYLRSTGAPDARVRWISDAIRWENLGTVLGGVSGGPAMVVRYARDDKDDLDVYISDMIRMSGVIGAAIAGQLTGNDPLRTSVMLSPFAIKAIFDQVWTNVIDPKTD
jgi:phosphatidylserine/phosphatidylglycerophosphate/cardiolipin synthase-like enzyme